MVRRGEVWWVEDPDSGRRPHLVLTRDVAVPVLDSLLVVPTTRTIRGIPTEVALGTDDGMPEACVLVLDNATSMPKAYLRDRICALGPDRMAQVCRALEHTVGCR